MRVLISLCFFFFLSLTTAQSQQKKAMTPAVYDQWSTIGNTQFSNDGLWISYELRKEEGDSQQCLFDASNDELHTFPNSKGGRISADNRYLVFQIHPPTDSLKAMRRRKVDKENLPVPSLAIFDFQNQQIDTIPRVASFSLPEKWSGALAYLLAPAIRDTTIADSLQAKKENEKNGFRLALRELTSKQEQTFPYVTEHTLAEEGAQILFTSKGDKNDFQAGVYIYDFEKGQLQNLLNSKGDYQKLCLDWNGKQAAFLHKHESNKDKTAYELYYWSKGNESATKIARAEAPFLPKEWQISQHGKLRFSKNKEKLFFGIAPAPIVQDSTLLEEEIVNVEVWHYQDKRIYPQQQIELEKDQKKTYDMVYHLRRKNFVQLGNTDTPHVLFADEGNANATLAYNDQPYLERISWEGFPSYRDVYWIDLKSGMKKRIAKELRAEVRLSPDAQYAYWYSTPDSAWYAWSATQQSIHLLHQSLNVPFYDELNDSPKHPWDYGIAGWTEKDKNILIYDRYDIWKMDPSGRKAPQRLTRGREAKTIYRYLKTDHETRFIDSKLPGLLHAHQEKDKNEAYYQINWNTGKTDLLISGNFAFSKKPLKAKDNNHWVFTAENYQTFPDLLYNQNGNFQESKKISLANIQQYEYNWGSIEPYTWTAPDGQILNGLLVKPENFDPSKKYPLLVNFYERSSDRLHRHRAPYPHRSSINYTYYASKGYVIFNPDVPYQVGYPGKSAERSVISGINDLLSKGFIDTERVGVQGHSWGGYQVAHLLTKTDIFRCAESGAPVVNMFSAYGGIRWRSGLSRMFQYEHTQSRIGATIWENPELYMENSPLFNLDKVNTPVLILHNDKDGAVPWYQGIEYFVGLRRLGKPSWLLNYNGEPHWPVKRQNRLDFNLRMEQFFDHYLMDAPMPSWMQRGVPAIEKGILQGLER